MELRLWVLSTPLSVPTTIPPKLGESRELRRLHGEENPFYDCSDPVTRPGVPIPLPGWAPCVVPHQKFRMPAAKARHPNLPNSRTTTREKRQ